MDYEAKERESDWLEEMRLWCRKNASMGVVNMISHLTGDSLSERSGDQWRVLEIAAEECERAAVEEEREACAKVCDVQSKRCPVEGGHWCHDRDALAIRARSEQDGGA